jgi:dienelactone hydrolase
MGNAVHRDLDYQHSLIDDLAGVTEYCIRNSARLCGSDSPVIYLMGFSAGASATAAVAGLYPEVKKILLIAPSGDADATRRQQSMATFAGEVCVVIGAKDDVVYPEAAQFFADLATAAASVRVFTIPDCDHQFKGELNGRLMSSLPLLAFTDQISEPCAERGIRLY